MSIKYQFLLGLILPIIILIKIKKFKSIFVLILFLILFLIFSNANAQPLNEDDRLFSLGLIGQDYKYRNIDKVTQYFRIINNTIAKSLPMQVDSYTEITSTAYTPFVSFYSYRFLHKLSKEQEINLGNEIKTKENFDDLCKSFFNSKFLIANNHVFILEYMNSEYRKIATFNLNRQSCDLDR